jgi:1,2-diacylglycerol 3-beta-galactosyltransferase
MSSHFVHHWACQHLVTPPPSPCCPQVVVICGRNRSLLQRLQARVWPGATRVLAVGFVDNIHEWMGAVDAIITKAGPGTIAEALISGLPILLNGNIPCQVRGGGGVGGRGLGRGRG